MRKYSSEHSAEVEILARDNSSNKVSANFVTSYSFPPEAFSVSHVTFQLLSESFSDLLLQLKNIKIHNK